MLPQLLVTAVTLWHCYRGTERTALEQLADRWNATHPEVRLELLALPYDAFNTKVRSAVPHGHGPDLFIFAHEHIGEWVDEGLLAPLELPPATAADLLAPTLAAVERDGKRWGLPLA